MMRLVFGKVPKHNCQGAVDSLDRGVLRLQHTMATTAGARWGRKKTGSLSQVTGFGIRWT